MAKQTRIEHFTAEDRNCCAKANREYAYKHRADPLFFKAQRGDDGITMDDYRAEVEKIKNEFPYYTEGMDIEITYDVEE